MSRVALSLTGGLVATLPLLSPHGEVDWQERLPDYTVTIYGLQQVVVWFYAETELGSSDYPTVRLPISDYAETLMV